MSATVYAQSGSGNTQANKCDGVCYTDEMDKAAQECWENAAERDSVLHVAKNLVVSLNDRLKVVAFEKEAISQRAFELETDLKKEKKRANRNMNIAIIEGAGLAGMLAIFIFVK